jgi:hypothetical protein
VTPRGAAPIVGSMRRMRSVAMLLPLCLLPQDPIRTSFAVLSGFEWTAGMKLPDEVTKLDSQKVQLGGFMMRETPGSGPVAQFLLINDACGCTGTPKMNEIVFCSMPEGTTTEIKNGVTLVTGTLYVGEQKEEDEVIAIYVMDVDSIQ